MNTYYTPGSALVLVGENALVATGPHNATRLLALTGEEISPLRVIEALSGGSLGELSDFACLVRDGADLRMVLRGQFEAHVEAGADRAAQSLSGVGVGTWTERTVAGGAGAVVRLVALADVAPHAWELPVASGIVLASRVAWAAERPETSERVSTPEPSATVVELFAPSAAAPQPAAQTVALQAVAAEPVMSAPLPAVSLDAAEGSAVSVADLPDDATLGEEELAQVVETLNDEVGAPGPGTHPAEVVDVTIAEVTLAPGDHDGQTITVEELRALRGEQPVEPAPPAQPAWADVVLPDGTRHPVAPRVLIGRRPEARQMASGGVPTLVSVSGPFISSTHVEVAVNGNLVEVTDLSTNGTLMIQPGQSPQTLVKGQPTSVVPGTVLALADDFAISVELPAGG